MDRHRHPDGLVHGVVVACQRDDGRWLLIRRGAHVAAPGKVCFPGGGVEPDEAHRDTAIREMREELGVEIEPVDHVWHYLSPTAPLRLFGWRARLLTDTLVPDPHEVAQVLWLTDDQILRHPDIMPGTEQFVAMLQNTPWPESVNAPGRLEPR